jgi:hypothetical protein
MPFLPAIMILLYLRVCFKLYSGYSLKKYPYQLGMGIFLLITAGIIYALSSLLFPPGGFSIISLIVYIEEIVLLITGLVFITFAIATKIRS